MSSTASPRKPPGRSRADGPADESPGAPPGSVAELLQVAIPLIVSSGSLSLMHVVDRIFLTWLSVDALAAAMPAGMFHWTALAFPYGVAIYTNTFVAQYHGAGRRDRVAASLWQGIWLALAFGLALMIGAPFLSRLFSVLEHTPEVVRLESEYFAILCLGSAPMLLSATLSTFFSGRGQNSTLMWVNLFSSLVNIGLDYVLIFGFGPFPKMGIRGAALATVIANVAACAAFAYMIRRTNRRERYPFRAEQRLDAGLLRRMLRFGLPNGVQFLVDIGAYLLLVLVIGRLGTVPLAATNLAFNLNSLAFIPMMGLGTAVLTIVGRRIGEGRPEIAARSVWRAHWLSLAYMFAFAVLYVLVPDWLLAPYALSPKDAAAAAEFEQVRPVVTVLLRFVAAYAMFDAMAIVFGNGIRGAGDTRFSLVFTFLTGWFLMVVPSILAVQYAERLPNWGVLTMLSEQGASPSLWACWWAATLNITVLGVGLLIRFQGGRWRTMRVIEAHPVPDSDAEIEAAVV
ncbi:MAG: MATE family efflux transporter [Planctomyces sp.]|nr:MATE family efflux transporter [Planctomyces sp.]